MFTSWSGITMLRYDNQLIIGQKYGIIQSPCQDNKRPYLNEC